MDCVYQVIRSHIYDVLHVYFTEHKHYIWNMFMITINFFYQTPQFIVHCALFIASTTNIERHIECAYLYTRRNAYVFTNINKLKYS